MRKLFLILQIYLLITGHLLAQKINDFPVSLHANELPKKDGVYIPDFLQTVTIPKDSVRKISFSTLEFNQTYLNLGLLEWLSDLKNLEELYINYPENQELLANDVSDSIILIVNKIFQNKRIKYVKVCNANYDSSGLILKHLLDGVNSIEQICFEYNGLTETLVNLPDFITSFPNLKRLGVLSIGYPVIMEQGYTSKFPESLQKTSVSGMIDLLHTLRYNPLYANKYFYSCAYSVNRSSYSDDLFAVFLGDFTEGIEKKSKDTVFNDKKIRSPFYIVNSRSKNFLNIKNIELLKEIKFLLMYGRVSKGVLKFISTETNISVLMNITDRYPSKRFTKKFPKTTIVFLKYNQSHPTAKLSISEFIKFKSQQQVSELFQIYCYELNY